MKTLKHYDLIGKPLGASRKIGKATYQIFEAITLNGNFQGYVIQRSRGNGIDYFPENTSGAAETLEELTSFLDRLEGRVG